MPRLSHSISLAALALATAAHAQSQSAQFTADPRVDTVVVTATRVPTPTQNVASSITVFTADDIAAKQEQTLPGVLQDAPGLNVVQTGGPGGQTSVFMRGTNSNHVKVLVDGIDVGDPSSPNGAFDFGQFLTPDIARVEILRGPQSGLYGSDAVGGVINVITKSGEGPPRIAAGLEGGSFATFNQDGSILGSTGPFHYSADIEHFHSGATPVTPLDLLLPGERRIDDDYDNVTASTKLGYDVTSDFALGLVARYTDTHLKFTGENEDDYPNDFPDMSQTESDTRQYYIRGSGRLSLFGGRFEQTLGVAYGDIRTTTLSPDFGTSQDAGDRFKIDWQGNLNIVTGETLVIGAEHEREAISLPISASTSIDSGYAELVSNPFKDFNDTISVRYDANDRFGGATTWRIAPTYFIEATGTKLEASVGTGLKAPTLDELFQNFPPYFFANPNLKPESDTGVDAGFEQSLAGGRLRFGATYFHIKIKDLIDDNASFTSYANVGRAHTDGVESFVSLKPTEAITLRVDYTYTEAYDDILDQELLRRPKNKWNLDARWRATRRLSLDLDLVSVGPFIDGNRDFSIPRLVANGYTTLALAAGYDINRHLTLYGRVTNLFDETYQDPDGYLRPGRGFFAGVKARF